MNLNLAILKSFSTSSMDKLVIKVHHRPKLYVLSSVSCSGWKTNLIIVSLDCREPFFNKDGFTDIFELSRSLNCITKHFISSSLFYEVVSDSSVEG